VFYVGYVAWLVQGNKEVEREIKDKFGEVDHLEYGWLVGLWTMVIYLVWYLASKLGNLVAWRWGYTVRHATRYVQLPNEY
jgi:lauroyl/myristoyl acyltransferase